MTWWTALLAALAALASGNPASFKVGPVTVTITDKAGGKPNHLTFAQLLLAAEMALPGQPGTFQIGDLTVTITV